jgi:hypothetical protein
VSFVKHVETFLALCLGLSVTFAALGAILAFGMFAFSGVPLLAVGLGLLSAAIDDV